jgi:hypothetical protein
VSARGMSVEPFGSGAVLDRAAPILTFATTAPGGTSARPGPGGPPARVESPWASDSMRAIIPVIPHIVRRTARLSDGLAGTWIAQLLNFRVLVAIGASAFARLVGWGLGLAFVGALAGLAIRSLSETSTTPSGSSSRADATAVEPTLMRAPEPRRLEHPVEQATQQLVWGGREAAGGFERMGPVTRPVEGPTTWPRSPQTSTHSSSPPLPSGPKRPTHFGRPTQRPVRGGREAAGDPERMGPVRGGREAAGDPERMRPLGTPMSLHRSTVARAEGSRESPRRCHTRGLRDQSSPSHPSPCGRGAGCYACASAR